MNRLVQSHSQHNLRGSSFIAELIGHSNIRKNDTVLDIGAGTGAITAVLANRASKVIAYEPERGASAKLHENMAQFSNVEVMEHDFLKADLPTVPYKVFSNIPFHLSSKIVRKLVESDRIPKSIYLIVQKQFGQKLLTDGDHFHGALGMAIAPWWVARIRRPLRRTDFTPPPAVDTVLLELKPREAALLPRDEMKKYMEFVENCYAEPRFYARAGGSKTRKPSQLTLAAWVAFYRAQ